MMLYLLVIQRWMLLAFCKMCMPWFNEKGWELWTSGIPVYILCNQPITTEWDELGMRPSTGLPKGHTSHGSFVSGISLHAHLNLIQLSPSRSGILHGNKATRNGTWWLVPKPPIHRLNHIHWVHGSHIMHTGTAKLNASDLTTNFYILFPSCKVEFEMLT